MQHLKIRTISQRKVFVLQYAAVALVGHHTIMEGKGRCAFEFSF